VIHSDYGSNFVGSDKTLKEFMAKLKEKNFSDPIINFCDSQGIKWDYIP